MIEAYLMHEKERAAMGIPALPLSPEQTAELCKLLVKPPKGKEKFLLGLLKDRVSPGVDPAAKVKAEFLAEIVTRVQVPRKVALAMREMLWNQGRFEKTQGKAPLYFLRRPGFADAFEYLRFTSELTGERLELRAWWKEFIRAHPVVPGEAVPAREKRAAPPARRTDGRRRRPRRRGPKPGAPKA